MKVALVGATGMVGQKMLQILEERNFPVTQLLPVASQKSVGEVVRFRYLSAAAESDIPIISMQDAIAAQPDIALFSAGGSVSLEYAPAFAAVGTTVIDNSSAFRMDHDKKLIVPEINGHLLTQADNIIANPNCSTIQMVLALHPLHKEYGIKRIVVSTYQSISGTGKKAMDQLENERNKVAGPMAYPYPIDGNVLPHCDVFEEAGYTKEELKLHRETQKILDDMSIAVTATAVRVPVSGGHSEAVNVEFLKDYTIPAVMQLLKNQPGVTLVDNPDVNMYPMPITAWDKDDVFVGRIRRDLSQRNTLNLWIVSDNLRKGAATNAVQIAEIVAGL